MGIHKYKDRRNERKRKRFNQLHQDLPKNSKGNASRTAWAELKRKKL